MTRAIPATATFEWIDTLAHRLLRVDLVPLERLRGWEEDPRTGFLRHRTGRFFTVVGIESADGRGGPRWRQPILDQPDIGILGVLARMGEGVPELLVQGKVEPGNVNGVQLAPTVQATSSNYERVHGGRAVPYLELFRDPAGRRLADCRQSEHGDWFDRKSNRNMVVAVAGRIEPDPGFRWLSLPELHRMLEVDDLVNMDMRSVLACLPFASTGLLDGADRAGGLAGALARSYRRTRSASGTLADVQAALAAARRSSRLVTHRRPLRGLPGWVRAGGVVRHAGGRHFEVVGVDVAGEGREVDRWSQPMIRAVDVGLAAMLVTRIDGVAHVLASFRAEPGYRAQVEIGPTVSSRGRWADLGADVLPPHLATILSHCPDGVRFDVVQSEEGGRLFQTRTRHLVVESGYVEPGPGHRWLTLGQLEALVAQGHAVDIDARSLMACFQALVTRDPA
ncbi:NDP-hexose 2,3-dehydratase family protein [Phytohabitans suffuscus]|uniref:NDP-hexose 2,3-dehydratase family protein n=1 Tax=Phytohabitans suffuscus TaxID=624315 RepID=UPI0018D5E661|nr:NDP-hexose 2,3-dehydratase family protein [Phytohabitans suffuscus]